MNTLYVKSDCPECERFKKLLDTKNVKYDTADLTIFPENWRETGFSGAMAHSMANGGIVPILCLDGVYFTPEEMEKGNFKSDLGPVLNDK